jgi:hypothetical protein
MGIQLSYTTGVEEEESSGTPGSVKWKLAPLPGCDSAQILPPYNSTIRRHIARPNPVPGTAEPCGRVNGSNIDSAFSGLSPDPSSRTVIRHRLPTLRAEMVIDGSPRFAVY